MRDECREEAERLVARYAPHRRRRLLAVQINKSNEIIVSEQEMRSA